mgnify:CR=1 FL=1
MMLDFDMFDRIGGFDWDEGNIGKNWDKHQVSPFECEEVFFNKPLIAANDEKHTKNEERYVVLGITRRERLLSIIFTIRGNKIRVISARDMNKKERGWYR